MTSDCANPADVIVALDSSASVGPENFLKTTDFVRRLMTDLPIQDDVRLGMLAYATQVQVRVHYNCTKSAKGCICT